MFILGIRLVVRYSELSFGTWMNCFLRQDPFVTRFPLYTVCGERLLGCLCGSLGWNPPNPFHSTPPSRPSSVSQSVIKPITQSLQGSLLQKPRLYAHNPTKENESASEFRVFGTLQLTTFDIHREVTTISVRLRLGERTFFARWRNLAQAQSICLQYSVYQWTNFLFFVLCITDV